MNKEHPKAFFVRITIFNSSTEKFDFMTIVWFLELPTVMQKITVLFEEARCISRRVA